MLCPAPQVRRRRTGSCGGLALIALLIALSAAPLVGGGRQAAAAAADRVPASGMRAHQGRCAGMVEEGVGGLGMAAAGLLHTRCGGVQRLRGGMEMGLRDGFRQGSPTPMAVKRIKGEVASWEKNPPTFMRARPQQDDLLDWHFVLLGGEDSAFQGGVYHGRIMLDTEYPLKPPRIFFFSESGRFETGVPLCLSMTSHHEETWQPTWDVRTALTALRGFMETPSEGAVGGMDMHDDDRAYLARLSRAMPVAIPGLKSEHNYEELVEMHQSLHKELCQAAGIPLVSAGVRKRGWSVDKAGMLNMLSPSYMLTWLLHKAGVMMLRVAAYIGAYNWRKREGKDEGMIPAKGKDKERGSKASRRKRQIERMGVRLGELEAEMFTKDDKVNAAERRAQDAEEQVKLQGEHIEFLHNQLCERDQMVTEIAAKLNDLRNRTGVDLPLAMHGHGLEGEEGLEKSTETVERMGGLRGEFGWGSPPPHLSEEFEERSEEFADEAAALARGAGRQAEEVPEEGGGDPGEDTDEMEEEGKMLDEVRERAGGHRSLAVQEGSC